MKSRKSELHLEDKKVFPTIDFTDKYNLRSVI